jgi:hypothetical protein
MLLLLAADVRAAAPVDIDTAATLYQDAAIREQVRASLPSMPAQIRKLFATDATAGLSEQQLAAVTAAAQRGFRIDVFEAPALRALALNLDPATVRKTEAFLASDLGRRMVAADVAIATLEQAKIDQIMGGQLTVPSSPQRDALLAKLERATRSTESTVQIFLSMGSAVAIGTAVGSGMDPAAVTARAQKSGDSSRESLEQEMREPLRRYLAYDYRDLSDADLKHLLEFLESGAGKRYVSAYLASMEAGFDAMGKRCGEQLGESLREMAQAQLATQRDDPQPHDDPRQSPKTIPKANPEPPHD